MFVVRRHLAAIGAARSGTRAPAQASGPRAFSWGRHCGIAPPGSGWWSTSHADTFLQRACETAPAAPLVSYCPGTGLRVRGGGALLGVRGHRDFTAALPWRVAGACGKETGAGDRPGGLWSKLPASLLPIACFLGAPAEGGRIRAHVGSESPTSSPPAQGLPRHQQQLHLYIFLFIFL